MLNWRAPVFASGIRSCSLSKKLAKVFTSSVETNVVQVFSLDRSKHLKLLIGYKIQREMFYATRDIRASQLLENISHASQQSCRVLQSWPLKLQHKCWNLFTLIGSMLYLICMVSHAYLEVLQRYTCKLLWSRVMNLSSSGHRVSFEGSREMSKCIWVSVTHWTLMMRRIFSKLLMTMRSAMDETDCVKASLISEWVWMNPIECLIGVFSTWLIRDPHFLSRINQNDNF